MINDYVKEYLIDQKNEKLLSLTRSLTTLTFKWNSESNLSYFGLSGRLLNTKSAIHLLCLFLIYRAFFDKIFIHFDKKCFCIINIYNHTFFHSNLNISTTILTSIYRNQRWCWSKEKTIFWESRFKTLRPSTVK